MATVATMTMLFPPQPTFTRLNRASAHLDNLQLSEQFWQAVKLDSPTSPTFDSSLDASPIDEKIMRVVHVDETTTTFVDDPIVGFETLDCYSPNRPRFTPTMPDDHANNSPYQPCPFGEPLSLCTSPAPTLGSIRYDKPASRSASPWAAMTLRPTRFRESSFSSTNRQGPSVLAFASAFLDSIVRLARSRKSTPTTFTDDGGGPVTILESEVLINVLEDGKRAALHGASTSFCGIEKALGKLEIPPVSAISSAAGNFWDAAGPMTSTEGPATCSQELDAMSKVDWERQLSGTKAHAFELRVDGLRGRTLRQ